MLLDSHDLEKKLESITDQSCWFTSDSRNFSPGDVFIALNGKTQDGHKYVQSVLDQGASLVVVEYNNQFTREFDVKNESRIAVVECTYAAHRRIAAHFRKKYRGKVIAVAGSNGKTTTKDCLTTLMSEKFKVVSTSRSQNGYLGIPKTLEKLRPNIDFAIIEIGIDAPGDMQSHCELVIPDYAILTSIGEEHLRQLKDISTVFVEETVLYKHVFDRAGRTFIPSEDRWLMKLKNAPGIVVVNTGNSPSKKKSINTGVESSIALAIATAKHFGLSDLDINVGLCKFKLPPGRGNVYEVEPDLWIIADHYNSNPASLKSSIAAAAHLATEKKLPLHFIIADMSDLGEESHNFHLEIIRCVNAMKPESLHLIGRNMGAVKKAAIVNHCTHYETAKNAAEIVDTLFKHKGVYLLKGSRVMGLELLLFSAAEKRKWSLPEEHHI